MSTKRQHIEVRGLDVEVVRKDIKHLHLGVYPPNGRVRVAAPARLKDEDVRLAVIARLAWIQRKQAAFEEQERQSEREMVTGESHFVEGRRYRLDVLQVHDRPSLAIRNNTTLELRVPPEFERDEREQVLLRWYRTRLREQLRVLVPKWEAASGLHVAEWRIKRMKTKWGSCNIEARRIWLNLELAKKPSSCLEYIVVHEMVHLLERNHNERFVEHMNRLLPSWRHHRDELNRAPLAHEDWTY